jgi:hypothetical protein
LATGWAILKLRRREIMPKAPAVSLRALMLPLTGQYTHYSLDKKPANRIT